MNNILEGDALTQLKTLEDDSIDCVVTSPPYWGLRDYGTDQQLGMEKDFREFITNLADIFDEVYRVLHPSGTLWVNLGDTYMGNASYSKHGRQGFGNDKIGMVNKKDSRVRAKSLCNIPERFAIEMTDRGWILRNTIIWHKPNCMPQSVTDRFTVDFEKIFFFTKSPKYFFDQQAVAEPITDATAQRLLQDIENQKGSARANGGIKTSGNMKAVGRKPFTNDMGGGGSTFKGHSGYRKADGTLMVRPTRNKRTVWTVTTKGFKDAHFAVYPEKLIETPILAGCPEGGVVLDPFFGSGTTGVVARKFNRNYIGIELNPDYIKIAEKRLSQATLF